MFYDRGELNDFSNLVLDHTRRAFAAESYVVDSNILALLADDKAALELKVAEIRERSVIQEFFSAASNCEVSVSNISLVDFVACSDGNISFGQAKSSSCGFYQEEPPVVLPGTVLASSSSLAPPHGVCPHCLYQGPLITEQVVGCGPASYYTLCPVCYREGNTEDIFEGISGAFVYLSKIEPWVLLSCPEVLLRLVIAAIGHVAYLLKAKFLRRGIATRQRTFFTHHGAHPPRVQSQEKSGLLRGKVFQPQFAA